MSFTKKQNAVAANCTGKPRYRSYQEAAALAKRSHGNAKLCPYHCASCGDYHIGSRSVRKLIRPRAPLFTDNEDFLAYGVR